MATKTTKEIRAMKYEKAGDLPTWALIKALYKRYELELLYIVVFGYLTLLVYKKIMG